MGFFLFNLYCELSKILWQKTTLYLYVAKIYRKKRIDLNRENYLTAQDPKLLRSNNVKRGLLTITPLTNTYEKSTSTTFWVDA